MIEKKDIAGKSYTGVLYGPIKPGDTFTEILPVELFELTKKELSIHDFTNYSLYWFKVSIDDAWTRMLKPDSEEECKIVYGPYIQMNTKTFSNRQKVKFEKLEYKRHWWQFWLKPIN